MRPRFGVCLLIVVCVLAGVATAGAGLLDAVHVRAKVDAPLEADQPGYEVVLFDTHSDSLMISVGIHVPEDFGKVDVASLDMVNAQGKKVAEVSLAPAIPPNGKSSFECNLDREYLKNSVIALAHDAKETLDCVVIHLGTFEVRDFKSKNGPPSPPKIWLALAEQGIPGEHDGDFTLTDKVPFVEGQEFGFRMYFRGDGRTFPVRVEQTLPSPPKTWGEPEAVKRLKISEDGCTASFTVSVPGDKLFEHGWMIAEGEPEGDYVFKVFVRDELIKTFTFHVRKESS